MYKVKGVNYTRVAGLAVSVSELHERLKKWTVYNVEHYNNSIHTHLYILHACMHVLSVYVMCIATIQTHFSSFLPKHDMILHDLLKNIILKSKNNG